METTRPKSSPTGPRTAELAATEHAMSTDSQGSFCTDSQGSFRTDSYSNPWMGKLDDSSNEVTIDETQEERTDEQTGEKHTVSKKLRIRRPPLPPPRPDRVKARPYYKWQGPVSYVSAKLCGKAPPFVAQAPSWGPSPK
jgi:hypothetical protein